MTEMAQQGGFFEGLIEHCKDTGGDLGHEHYLRLYTTNGSVTGATLIHRPGPNGTPGEIWCMSRVEFKPGNPNGWAVESFEPMTLSPSIQCSCGDHGYIRGGLWLPV